MTINAHITEFAGLPVVDFVSDMELPADPSGVAWRIRDSHVNDTLVEQIELLLAQADPADIRALIVCAWSEPSVADLLALAPRLTGLRALFLGEMTSEEYEISWILQDDVTPLLAAYPELEVLRVRGTAGLRLTPVRHTALRELAFESGGLPASVVRAVAECDLPALTHLELWLGTDGYGGDATVADLAPILAGTRLPTLRYLGLRDAEIADEVAAVLATAPVVAPLDTLDLSLGALSDAGVAALLAGQSLSHLRRLDLHHHFVSREMAAQLTAALPGVEVDLSERKESGGHWRYVAVSE